MECIGMTSVFLFMRLTEILKDNSLASAEISLGLGSDFLPLEHILIDSLRKLFKCFLQRNLHQLESKFAFSIHFKHMQSFSLLLMDNVNFHDDIQGLFRLDYIS